MYLPVLEALLSSSEVTIYTSVMSTVEVSFGGVEQTGRLLDPAVEDLINGLWADPGGIVVEGQAEIGEEAKGLMRDTFPRGWRLKPADAIHLATAKGLIDSGGQVDEFIPAIRAFASIPAWQALPSASRTLLSRA